MTDDERVQDIKRILSNYVLSPSIRHLRDPRSIHNLALDIIRTLDGRNAIWSKWTGQRETFLRAAIGCWVPVADLEVSLNRMPGPRLTRTDVEQRLKAFEDETPWEHSNEALKDACLAIFAEEKAAGTELPAIIGRLRDFTEIEEERIRREQRERYDAMRAEERIAQERKLLSGADCNWTNLGKSKDFYCRLNGRLYRLSPTVDKMWTLIRVDAIESDASGIILGKYQTRGNATKAVRQIAYQPE